MVKACTRVCVWTTKTLSGLFFLGSFNSQGSPNVLNTAPHMLAAYEASRPMIHPAPGHPNILRPLDYSSSWPVPGHPSSRPCPEIRWPIVGHRIIPFGHSVRKPDAAGMSSAPGSDAAFADARDDASWPARRRGPREPAHWSLQGAAVSPTFDARTADQRLFPHLSVGLPVRPMPKVPIGPRNHLLQRGNVGPGPPSEGLADHRASGASRQPTNTANRARPEDGGGVCPHAVATCTTPMRGLGKPPPSTMEGASAAARPCIQARARSTRALPTPRSLHA